MGLVALLGRATATCFAGLLLTIAGCNRGAPPTVDRLAILPFENLTGDPSLDWISVTGPNMLGAQIAGSPTANPLLAESLRQAYSERATRVLHGYFTAPNGKLRFEFSIEDPQAVKTVKTFSAEGSRGAGIVPLIDSLARQIDHHTQAYGTTNAEALRQFGVALLARDLPARSEALEKAIAADPNYGAAYVGWANTLVAMNDRPGCEAAIRKGLERGTLIGDVSRAQLELAAALLSNNPAERDKALLTLSHLTPNDSGVTAKLAESSLSSRKFAPAVELYRKALKVDPENPALWNALGYAEGQTANLEGAKQAFERYGRFAGQEANALDSLGEVYFYNGRFADSEKNFLAAHAKNPGLTAGGDLLKAAQAHLLTGDRDGADQIFHKYTDFLQARNNPAVELVTGQWEFITGRQAQAITRLHNYIPRAAGESAAYAHTQLAIWYLQGGDGERAKAEAEQVPITAANLSVLARFVTLPAKSAAEWATMAEKAFPTPEMAPLRDRILSYALLLSKNFEQATPLLKQAYEQADPNNDGPLRALYAWSLAESGRVDEAAPLVQQYPIPLSQGDVFLASIGFPKFLDVRAKVRQAQGKQEDARTLEKLYHQYSSR